MGQEGHAERANTEGQHGHHQCSNHHIHDAAEQPVDHPDRTEIEGTANGSTEPGAEGLAKDHQDECCEDDGGKAPGVVRHPFADERNSEKRSYRSGNEARDPAEGHQEPVAETGNEIPDQCQHQQDVQDGEVRHVRSP